MFKCYRFVALCLDYLNKRLPLAAQGTNAAADGGIHVGTCTGYHAAGESGCIEFMLCVHLIGGNNEDAVTHRRVEKYRNANRILAECDKNVQKQPE